MRMSIRQMAIYAALALLLISAPRFAAADPIISAPFVTVNVGDTFTIPVSITGAVDLTSWQFDLSFSPTIVQANSVTEGPFMSSFGATLFIPGFIDNGSGQILGVAGFYIDLPPFPSGDGVLADIEFTALAQGVLPLTFSNVFLNLSDQGFGITNGQITAIPEPTTMWLLASGLVLLGMRRLARRRRGATSSNRSQYFP